MNISTIVDDIIGIGRGGSRTAATSKMEYFVIIVNGWKPLTIITKSSILDVAAVLDPSLIGKKCAMFGVKDVVVSSIVLQRQFNLTKIIRQVNDLLKGKCKENNFHFVCNDNVTREYLWRDDIYLNNEGIRIFAGNLIDYLNYFILVKVSDYQIRKDL